VLTHTHKLGSTDISSPNLGYLFEDPAIEVVSQGFTLHTRLSDGVATVGRRLAGVERNPLTMIRALNHGLT